MEPTVYPKYVFMVVDEIQPDFIGKYERFITLETVNKSAHFFLSLDMAKKYLDERSHFFDHDYHINNYHINDTHTTMKIFTLQEYISIHPIYIETINLIDLFVDKDCDTKTVFWRYLQPPFLCMLTNMSLISNMVNVPGNYTTLQSLYLVSSTLPDKYVKEMIEIDDVYADTEVNDIDLKVEQDFGTFVYHIPTNTDKFKSLEKLCKLSLDVDILYIEHPELFYKVDKPNL